MKRLILVPALLCALAGCRDKTPDKPTAAAASKGADDDKDNNDEGSGVTLKKDAQGRAGIKAVKLDGEPIQPELIAYGRLEEDPSTGFVARAPASGILRAAPGVQWPSLGRAVSAGSVLGQVEPKLAISDRISLSTQVAAARADLNGALAAVTAAQGAYDRAKALNADNKNVSDRALAEAGARLAAEKAREAGARSLIQTLESLLATSASDARAVTVERSGDVVEVLAHPGESVEQGAALFRLANLAQLLVRIDLPVGDSIPPAGAVRIVPAGFEQEPPLAAEQVAVAASEPRNPGVTLLYRLSQTRPGLRPGIAVTAHFTLPGKSAEAIVIPRSAIVQHDGRQWVYIQTKDDKFSRRPVPLDQPTAKGFIVHRGFSEGDLLVTVGAQTLLSEEFKSANEADTN